MNRFVGYLFGFAIAVAYWPGISGAATSPRWAVAAFLAAILAMTWERIRFTWAHLIGALFLCWSFATYAWSLSPFDTIGASWKLIIAGCAFCVGTQTPKLRPVYVGAAIGLIVSTFVALAQWSGTVVVPDLPIWTFAPGLFVNELFFAEALALIVIALMAEGLWPLMVFLLAPLFMMQERAPFLAFSVGLLVFAWPRFRKIAICLAVLGVTFTALLSLGANRSTTVVHRLALWQSTISAVTPMGAGLGSFTEAAPQPIEGFHFEHPHNEFLETAYETGLVGASLLAAFFVVLLAMGRAETERALLVVLLVEMCFAFPLHEPFTLSIGALSAGYLARDLPRVRSTIAYCRELVRRRMAARRERAALRRFAQQS